ncbi:MAG: chromosome segregation protein SMC [Deltaproteobacteria bacterium]|nr:chromosome segregation protein SMC [Deltaproteobacteria bacterium]
MKLKRLEIQGFKSFPDRTVFDFHPGGLTVVVGPNGCGKSNIVDAVRWTLGEQSAKLLRGQMMEDVIFNGSDRRKPMGLAEVTLLFDNDGSLNGQWKDYAEISISRRLYRTGESDYIINGVPCRLKDVKELLADAGGSSRGYSIVEQGRISLLVNSRPEEKRALIEEAAGVLKYRMRRIEAERKLERTKQNLLRVSDIIREVKRQLDSLKRSAAKARRYRRFRDELAGLVLRLRFVEFGGIDGELGRLEEELSVKTGMLEAKEVALSGLEAREETLRVDLAAGEDQIAGFYETVRSIESEIARLEGDISVRESSISSLEERIIRLNGDEARLREKCEMERTERVQLELELKGIEDEYLRYDEELKEALSLFEEVEAELKAARESMDESRSNLFTIESERLRLVSEIESGRRSLESIERRKNEILHREEELGARFRKACDSISHGESHVEQSRNDRDKLSGDLRNHRDALSKSREELSILEEEISSVSERLAEVRGLQKTLASMEDEMEGFSDGVRGVMTEFAGSDSSGVLGVVADYIEVPQKFEIAVMAVLGERLQHVIVDRPERGLSAVDYLKERSIGRGGFIPMSPRSGDSPHDGLRNVKGDGVLGPLSDKVAFSDKLNGVGEFLLGNTLVVEDLGKALNLWKRNGFSATMVTLDGDVVEATGVITGGAMEGGEGDVLVRRRRLREVRQASESLEAELDKARAGRKHVRARITELDALLLELEKRHRDVDRKCLDEDGNLVVLRKERDHLNRALEDLQAERGMVEEEEAGIREHLAAGQARQSQVEQEELAARKTMEANERKSQQLGTLVETRRKQLEEARLKVNTVTLRKENFHRVLQTAMDRSQEVDVRLERIHEEIEESKKRILLHRAEMKAGAEAVEMSASDLQEKKGHLVLMREKQQEARSEAVLLAGKARETRSEAGAIRAECSSIDIKVHELRTERQNLIQRVREEHDLDLASLTAADFEGQEFDQDIARERIGSLRQKISTLGEVNPGAVEEFEELNQRYDFLTSQKEDLEESIDSLEKAIRKINRKSREKFLETFREVNENFIKLCPVLLDGGTGRMVLLDESDPLNTGVDIQVEPRGKKLKNMQLLSGGEKALISLIMILSMFLVRPSPFCIFDEVDAPLDYENLEQFSRIVKDLSATYQVLLITHNKTTMEAADVLYGITMREPGVSQVVSVKMVDVA